MKVYLTQGQYVRLQKIAKEYWNMHVYAYYNMAKNKEMYDRIQGTTKEDISWLSDNVKRFKALSDAYQRKSINIHALDVYEK